MTEINAEIILVNNDEGRNEWIEWILLSLVQINNIIFANIYNIVNDHEWNILGTYKINIAIYWW